MAKSRFNMSEIKKNAQSVAEGKGGGGGGGKVPYLKLNSKLSKILILPPKKKDQVVKRVLIHQVWKGGKPIKSATCPRIKEGESCKICKRGFDLKDKYEDSPSKKKQNLWRSYMPADDTFAGAMDITEKKPTPKVLRMPPLAFQTLVDELEESSDGSDIFDLDKGRPLIIKGNGKEGKNRRYISARFSKNAANLVADGKVDEDEIMDNIFDLDKLLPKISSEKVDEVFLALKKQEQSILSGGSEDDEDDDDSSDDDEPKSKKKKGKARDDDDEDESDDDDDSEVDADDADDDEDDDFEDDDADGDDDEDDEDEKPAKKGKKKSKSDDDDEEDDDDADDDDSDDEDDDSDDDEEDEDEKPVKKRASAKKASVKLKKKK